MDGLLKDGVWIQVWVVCLVADELNLSIRSCECVVVNEVVCLLINSIVISRSLTRDQRLYCCFWWNVTVLLRKWFPQGVLLLVNITDRKLLSIESVGTTDFPLAINQAKTIFSNSLLWSDLSYSILLPWNLYFATDIIATTSGKCLLTNIVSFWWFG